MGWADIHIEGLLAGQTVQFRPRGNSMRGRIDSGQLVTVAPLTEDPTQDAIVLCRVHGRQFLHLIKGVRGADGDRQFLIGNNRGGVNGWIARSSIYGVVTSIER